MNAYVGSFVTVLIAIVTLAFYLGVRLTKQDGVMDNLSKRIRKIEKQLGTWDEED